MAAAPETFPNVAALKESAVLFQLCCPISLAMDADKALQQLSTLYKGGQDFAIHQISVECVTRFKSVPEIMNLLFMAQVNLAMNGVAISSKILLNAIIFNAYSTWEMAMHKFPKHQDCERVKKLLADPFQEK